MLSLANKAVDAGAKSAAESGRTHELDYFSTHKSPPDADVAFFSHGGAPITGDVRKRVQQAVGLRTAALAMYSLNRKENPPATFLKLIFTRKKDGSVHCTHQRVC